MKVSVSLSAFKGGPTSPILFTGDVEKHIPVIAELGYDGVDFFSRDPSDSKEKMAARLLEKKGLGVGVVMPAALAGEGLTMADSDESVRLEFMKRIRPIIDFASDLNGMVSLGLIRGRRKEGESEKAFFDRYAESCIKLYEYSEKRNVKLVIEPINRKEINTLNSSIEAKDFILKYGLPVYLMLDTFHMNQEDSSITSSFESCRELVKHIHFLDSNRLAPGMGNLDMELIYKKIVGIGYDGYLCLEALRQPDAYTVAERGIEFFRRVGLK